MIFRNCAGIALVFSAFVLTLPSQKTPAPLPSDPSALLDLTRQKNGLSGPDIPPWHIHGTYKTYNEKGSVMQEGTYEEWWIGPAKYKRSFASSIFTQTDYADGAKLFRDGFQGWWSGFEFLLREQLVNPIPPASQLSFMHLENRALPFGGGELRCVFMIYPLRPNVPVANDYYPTACLESTGAALRLNSLGYSRQTTYDNVVVFKGHYIAKQLQFFSSGKLRAELTLDAVESLENPADTMFAPPPTAKEVDLSSITFLRSSFQYFPISLMKSVPEYPADAKSRHIQGVVQVHTLIGPDGRIAKMDVLKGAYELRQSAKDAVRQWVFRPPEIMGAPRAFATDIDIFYTLGQ